MTERNPVEYKIHCATVKHIRGCFMPRNIKLKAWHIANQGGKDGGQRGFHLKQMGVLPGFIDLMLAWRSDKLENGLLEIKAPGGKLTDLQENILEWGDSIGMHTGVAYSVREAHDHLVSWGLQPLYDYVPEPDLASKSEKMARAQEMMWGPKP